MDKTSESVDNIIVDAFTLNQGSPKTDNSKAYQSDKPNEITEQFNLYQNYQDFGCNQSHISQNS